MYFSLKHFTVIAYFLNFVDLIRLRAYVQFVRSFII